LVHVIRSLVAVGLVALVGCGPRVGEDNRGLAVGAGGESAGGTGGGTAGTGGAPHGDGGAAAMPGTGGSAMGGAPASGGAGGSGGARAPVVTRVGPPYDYPQNWRSPYCIHPTLAHPDDARLAYERWRTELVTTEGAGSFQRVRRPDREEDTTVSEGVAYGMILSLVMDDQALFDDLWRYSQMYVNGNGLMHWLISASGSVEGEGAATDADEDMAYALALAAHKWGGGGALDASYADLALAQIDRIWEHEIYESYDGLVVAGDSWGEQVVFNPSYFAPNQYRLFGRLTGNVEGWQLAIDKGYELFAAGLSAELGNLENGLLPAWANTEGQPSPAFDGAPTHYQYDSARIPFRIAQDYCEYGEPRAKALLEKLSNFFSAPGASGIVDGYELDGTPRPANTAPPGIQSALFVGAAGVGAMNDPVYQPFVDDVYALLVTKEMLPHSYYYNMSWQVFSLVMLSGNLFDYTLH
jgi:endo-1,4-beta-D-glucanase Y